MNTNDNSNSEQKTVNFGFKKVPANEKNGLVKQVFDSVAPVYDRMNDLMSLGIHRLWKEKLCAEIIKNNPRKLLDVGGGTGDIAFKCLDKDHKLKVYIADINKNMLMEGRSKSFDLGKFKEMNWLQVNAEKIPFKDNLFDAYSIAFCIRNVTDIPTVLTEAYRVLGKGGKFYCLEFSHIQNATLARLYDLWSFQVIPNLGRIIAKNKDAYSYLAESIRKFPKAEEFAAMIRQAGFKNVSYRSLNLGIASIHTGIKL